MPVPLLVRNNLPSPQRPEICAHQQNCRQVYAHAQNAHAHASDGTGTVPQKHAQTTRSEDEEERLKGESVEEEHGAVRVEEPRQIACGENQQKSSKTPVALQDKND